jgi:hypothetical protein
MLEIIAAPYPAAYTHTDPEWAGNNQARGHAGGQLNHTRTFPRGIVTDRNASHAPKAAAKLLLSPSEVQHVNFNSIDCSFGGICARRRGLGIQSLARLVLIAAGTLPRYLMPAAYERFNMEIDSRTLFHFRCSPAMAAHAQRQLEEEFASHNCAEHPRKEAAAS